MAARPGWCPHADCDPRQGSQGTLCLGELPAPDPHDGDVNTHRLCLRGAADDGGWVFDLKINRGDGWHIWRLLGALFDFKGRKK